MPLLRISTTSRLPLLRRAGRSGTWNRTDVVTAMGPAMPWNIQQINADKVQAANITGTGVRVAVIDTGIDYTHPDLAGVYAGGYNIITDNATGPMDDNGHGTHCAGILAATGSSNGIYGTAPGVRLYAVKVLSGKGEGRVSDVIAGIFWAKNNSMQVASMSLGLNEDSQALHDAVDEASADGVLIVAAAGNSGVASGSGDTMTYPGKYDSVLSVAAVNKYNHRAFWSSTGSHIGVSAPGVNIRLCHSRGRLCNLQRHFHGRSPRCRCCCPGVQRPPRLDRPAGAAADRQYGNAAGQFMVLRCRACQCNCCRQCHCPGNR